MKKRKSLKGVMTLEAAVIIPISLMIILAALYYAFFSHDNMKVKTEEMKILNRNAGSYKENRKSPPENIDGEISSHLLMARGLSTDISLKKDRMSIRGNADIELPLALLRQISGGDAEHIDRYSEISGLDARGEVLKYYALKKGLEFAGVIEDEH